MRTHRGYPHNGVHGGNAENGTGFHCVQHTALHVRTLPQLQRYVDRKGKMLFFLPAGFCLVTAIALGLYASRSANLRVRRYFWASLALGLVFSALALGLAGKWWLSLGPLIPFTILVLLRLRFPLIFGNPGKKPGNADEEQEVEDGKEPL